MTSFRPDQDDTNHVELSGRLGRDPDTRLAPGGILYASISVAIHRGWIDHTHTVKSETTWITVEAQDAVAQQLVQQFHKGSQIRVTGRLVLDQWTDRQTQTPRSKVKVRAIRLETPRSTQAASTPPL